MIRYNVLKEFLFNTDKALLSSEKTLLEKIKALAINPEEDPDE